MRKTDYTDKDFEGLMFPVHEYERSIELLKCPEFKRLRDRGKLFTDPFIDMDINSVLRYIILMFDINSPLHRMGPLDQKLRRQTAAKLAYFEPNEKGFYDDAILKMMLYKNKRVNKMIIHYSFLFYIPLYTKYVVLMKSYEKQMEILMDGEQEKDTLKIISDIEKEMENIVLKICVEDTSIDLARTLYLVVDEDQMDLSPEGVAKRRKHGGIIIDIDPQNLKRNINLRS